MEHNATAMMLCHNHPSGDATPSHADIELNSRVSEVLRTVGISLAEHIIVAGDDCLALMHEVRLSEIADLDESRQPQIYRLIR